jgi:hypothetical protein
MKLLPIRLALVSLMFFSASFWSGAQDFQDHKIVVDKELLITAPEVVDAGEAKYPGPLSFGHLVEQAFGKEEAPMRVAQWLQGWVEGRLPQKENEQAVPARAGLNEALIRIWQRLDGYDVNTAEAWVPKLANAPFRLLAIVNRMDLAQSESFSGKVVSPYGGSSGLATSENGEARLIFCLMEENGNPVEKGLTLIFEYGLDGNDATQRLNWAMAWHALGKHENFDEAYRNELTLLTRRFTDRGALPQAPAAKVDQTSSSSTPERMQLLRVRSNDGVGGAVREFREFGLLENEFRPVVMLGAPREEFYDRKSDLNRKLVRWLKEDAGKANTELQLAMQRNQDSNEPPVRREVVFPEFLFVDKKRVPVGGFASHAPDVNTHWDGMGMSDENLRRSVSLQSCCGCHCGDTNSEFYHVAPRREGEAAVLSKFLRTDGKYWSLKDPATKQSQRSEEMEDRRKFFESLLDPNLSAKEKRKIRESRRTLVH